MNDHESRNEGECLILSEDERRELDMSYAGLAFKSPSPRRAARDLSRSIEAAAIILAAIEDKLPGSRIVDKSVSRDGLITLTILPDPKAYLEATGILKSCSSPRVKGGRS